MEILNDSDKKLELEYPCSWKYKLIGFEADSIKEAILDVIDAREHKLAASNASKSGKYVSMNLELLVHNEDDRNTIYQELKAHQNIKMVL